MRHGWTLILLFAVLLAGCGTESEPAPEPGQLLEEAARHLQDASSFAVDITHEGPPAYVDYDGIISFKLARGYYVAPDRVQARVRVVVAGIAGDIDVIAVSGDQYYRHSMLTGGAWIQAEFSPNFDVEALVQSDRGMSEAIGSLKKVSLKGKDDLDGIPTWHLTGTASSSDVVALTVGLIMGTDEVNVDLYIGVDDHRPLLMRITQPEFLTEDNMPATWTIEVYDFDDPSHVIERPQ